MRLEDVAELQSGLFAGLAEDVEVGDPPVAARAIWIPDDADVPGTEQARRTERVTRLAFRESAGLSLRRETLVRFRGTLYEIDGSPDVADAMVVVALVATERQRTRPWSDGWSDGFGPFFQG